MATDIDSFIHEQKAKLARERGLSQENGSVNGGPSRRKTWKRDASAIPSSPQLAADRPLTPEDGGGLRVGESMDERQRRLQEERKREMREFLNQSKAPARRRPETPQETGLPLGQAESRKAALARERKREYNDLLQQQTDLTRRKPPSADSTHAINKVIGQYEQDRKRLDEERKREYNEMMAQKNAQQQRRAPPTSGPVSGSLPVGQNDQDRRRLDAERQQEYNDRLQSQKSRNQTENRPPPPTAGNRGQGHPPGTPEVGLISKLGGYEEKRKRLQEERKREYNDMIAKQQVRTRGVVTPGADDYARSIPGLRENQSVQDDRSGRPRHMEDHVLDEDALYERYLRDKLREAPRRGWATPTYEEILDKKRAEERAYRRGGYDENSAKQLGREPTLRSSQSDGHLNRNVQDELKRFKQLDQEYESKKVRFHDDRSRNTPYEPSVGFNPQSEFSQWDGNRNELDRIERDLAAMRRGQPPSRRDDPPPQRGNYAASLGVGANVTSSEDQRRKAAYRQDLQKQMQQAQRNKQREKDENLRVNATGLKGIFQPDEPVQQPTTRPPLPVSDAFRDLYSNPSDDAYFYYGKMNPLDPNAASEGIAVQAQLGPPISDRSVAIPAAAPSRRQPDKFTGETVPFPSDDDRSKSRADAKKNYQQELKRQIEEDKRKKEIAKKEQEAYDRKLEDEIRNYNPYGQGGGGAPMRDRDGNVLADLRKMNHENKDNLLSPRRNVGGASSSVTQYQPSVNFQSPRVPRDLSPPPPGNYGGGNNPSAAEENANFARGGHGIFGEPIDDAQKKQRSRYQNDLKAQIEEKKRQAELEKERQKEEEARLLQKIEEDNKRLQEDFEREKQKDRAKKEEAERQAEEIRRQQEEKRKEVDRKRMEEDEKLQNELRKQEEEKRRQREQQRDREERGRSPPVPALRSKTEPTAEHAAAGRDSPPLPSQRAPSRSQSRAQSADVLNQLAKLKAQLASESKRVETDLRAEQREPEVYDPRLYQRPNEPHHEVDVFNVADQKQQSTRRHRDEQADPGTVNEFSKLRKGSTASRQQIQKLFPDTPTSGDALETQQRVLLQAQEDNLSNLRKGKSRYPSDSDLTPKGLGLVRENSKTSANLLDSDSAFIDIPENGYPDSSRRRNDSARSRRRGNRNETPNTFRVPSDRSYDPRSNMGSQVSLDPDLIDRRNEERLRKLKAFGGDEQSLADPDDILDRFMSKQHHRRPPSGQTLQDDSWLRPGTHNR